MITQQPTKPGWYWRAVLDSDVPSLIDPVIVRLTAWEIDFIAEYSGDHERYQWYGPIEVPDELASMVREFREMKGGGK